MNIIKNIIADYENIIKTKITIPLDNGDIIKFAFHRQDLPHLLGLQHLVDNPVLFEYSQKRMSATTLYNRMCSTGSDAVDTDKFEESVYFEELYEGRIKYFSSQMLLDIINTRQIVKFSPERVKNFSTKLENIEYMFWKHYKDKNYHYGYFGIGFMSSGKKSDINYPNTFFFRMDNDYICNQKMVFPMSFMKIDKNKKTDFYIYWDDLHYSLRKNPHYKWLKKHYMDENEEIDFNAVKQSKQEETIKHLMFLKLDALDKVYLPYMPNDFRWSNDEKQFLLEKLEIKSIIHPSEIKMLLNQYKQKHSKITHMPKQ